MKRTFLIGVAAGALLAGANIASAQMMERGGGGGAEQRGGAAEQRGGGAMEQRGGGAMEQRGGGADQRGGGLEQRGPAATQQGSGGRAQTQDERKSTTGQGEQRQRDQGQREMQRGQEQRGQDMQRGQERGQDMQRQDTQRGQQDRDKSGATSGQGAGGAARSANLTVEQKTKIRDTVIRAKDAPRVTDVNFNISVGTVVPRTVRYAPLPPTLVEIYPEWRSYYYIIVHDEIVIIEPSSFKIVTVVNV